MPRRAQAGAQTSLCSPQAPGGRLCLIIPHLLHPPAVWQVERTAPQYSRTDRSVAPAHSPAGRRAARSATGPPEQGFGTYLSRPVAADAAPECRSGQPSAGSCGSQGLCMG